MDGAQHMRALEGLLPSPYPVCRELEEWVFFAMSAVDGEKQTFSFRKAPMCGKQLRSWKYFRASRELRDARVTPAPTYKAET